MEARLGLGYARLVPRAARAGTLTVYEDDAMIKMDALYISIVYIH